MGKKKSAGNRMSEGGREGVGRRLEAQKIWEEGWKLKLRKPPYAA